ncbi:TetR/AcrR family transcriptional regulator [Desulfothermobacter acidiphilus]|uniref:TetR/AcrR family transcriptional regulator n=1 Tax=Desulfothermobacter acidiphilus TaxID=1938353 RepID=UPI003F8ACFE1
MSWEKDSRERILAAAEELFAARGIEGARVDEIARRAGVNKRMIYHYFGSKEGLYRSVLEANHARALEAGRSALRRPLGLQERVAEAIRSYFHFLARHPNYPRLMAWEALQGGEHARQVLAQLRRDLLPELREVLEEGVREGAFRADLDLEQVLATVITLCSAHFSGRDPLEPGKAEERLKHITELVLRYVSPTK